MMASQVLSQLRGGSGPAEPAEAASVKPGAHLRPTIRHGSWTHKIGTAPRAVAAPGVRLPQATLRSIGVFVYTFKA
jgi:hypothetical protein